MVHVSIEGVVWKAHRNSKSFNEQRFVASEPKSWSAAISTSKFSFWADSWLWAEGRTWYGFPLLTSWQGVCAPFSPWYTHRVYWLGSVIYLGWKVHVITSPLSRKWTLALPIMLIWATRLNCDWPSTRAGCAWWPWKKCFCVSDLWNNLEKWNEW